MMFSALRLARATALFKKTGPKTFRGAFAEDGLLTVRLLMSAKPKSSGGQAFLRSKKSFSGKTSLYMVDDWFRSILHGHPCTGGKQAVS